MERKGMQVIKDVASKTAGLVFFSLLAIALGVVFGVMFERWVGGETGLPASSTGVDQSIEEAALPAEGSTTEAETPVSTTPQTVAVKYKVKVGPYSDYAQAARAAEELRAQGYPIYLANRAPFLIQVGAFTKEENALALKAELSKKGYNVAIQPE